MSKQRLELILGIVLIITPSTGFPLSFKFFIVFAIGVALVIISLSEAIKKRVGHFHQKMDTGQESKSPSRDSSISNIIGDPNFKSVPTADEGNQEGVK